MPTWSTHGANMEQHVKLQRQHDVKMEPTWDALLDHGANREQNRSTWVYMEPTQIYTEPTRIYTFLQRAENVLTPCCSGWHRTIPCWLRNTEATHKHGETRSYTEASLTYQHGAHTLPTWKSTVPKLMPDEHGSFKTAVLAPYINTDHPVTTRLTKDKHGTNTEPTRITTRMNTDCNPW